MSSLQTYLNKFRKAADKEEGKLLADFLSINHSHAKSFLNQNVQIEQIDLTVRNKLFTPWTEVATHHLKTLIHISNRDYEDAFESQKELVQAFQKGMSTMTRRCLPALYVINNDLRIIATRADEVTVAVEGERKKLEEAANVISKSFTYCITDRSTLDVSKKYGTYCMVGILFRIYFKLKQQNLCKNIIRAIKAADMPSIDLFPKGDRVTFRYYLGRLYFLEEDYVKAEIELNSAFKECNNKSAKNKELILQTLLPVKLMRGILPTKALFDKFPKTRQIYSELAMSIRDGDVKAFNNALKTSEPVLIRQGTYFAIEKAESIAVRQLFRKVYLIMSTNSRIPIQTFKKALDLEGLNVDIEEAEWMLANMIYKGYMKGYLSHEKMFLVLSKDNPFPSVSTVAQS